MMKLALLEKALVSLGLCCLIAKVSRKLRLLSHCSGPQSLYHRLWLWVHSNCSSAKLGTHPTTANHHGFADHVQLRILRALSWYCGFISAQVFSRPPVLMFFQAAKNLDFLLQILKAEESARAQAIIVTEFCRLLLAAMITESRGSASVSRL